MPTVRLLMVHNDQQFVQLVTHLLAEIGYRPNVISDPELFPFYFKVSNPHIILCKFGTEDFCGLELVRWLIEHKNTAKVIFSVQEGFEVANALERLVNTANLFPMSILRSPSSRTEILASLKI